MAGGMRRAAQVYVSGDTLHRALGLRDDVTIRGIVHDVRRDTICVVLQGDTLPTVAWMSEPQLVRLADVQQPVDVEQACRVMHRAYEAAAEANGWDTNPASRVVWEDVPEANQETMRAAVSALIAYLGRTAG